MESPTATGDPVTRVPRGEFPRTVDPNVGSVAGTGQPGCVAGVCSQRKRDHRGTRAAGFGRADEWEECVFWPVWVKETDSPESVLHVACESRAFRDPLR